MKTKKTPEELRQQRINSLTQARAARQANIVSKNHIVPPKNASPPVPPAEFLGITKNECCVDCTADRCVISGAPVCAHPCKGGLQASLMTKPDAVERYNRVRKHLAHVELDKRP